MRQYRLAYAGASALGLSPIQIVASGRVKSVMVSATVAIAAAVDNDYGILQVGTAGVSEAGIATAAPVNFAFANCSATASDAALGTMETTNIVIPCDAAVSAGQNLVLNLAGLSQAGSNWEEVNVSVWVG